MPVLASLALPKRIEERDPLPVRIARWLYAPVLRFVLGHRMLVLGLAFCGLLATVIVGGGLGSEFIPKLSEGLLS